MSISLTSPIVRDLVFKEMKVDSLFKIASISDAAKSHVKQMRWRITGVLVDFTDCKGKAYIQCLNYGLSEKEVSWELVTEDGKRVPKLVINGEIFDFSTLDKNMESTEKWTDEDFERWFVRHSLCYFCELFGRLHGVSAGMKIENMRDIENMNLLRHCIILNKSVSASAVTEFCHRFRGRTLLLHSVVDGPIEVTTPMMSVTHLFVKNGQWLNGEHLMRFSGKYAFLFKSNIFTNDVIGFVKKWLDGTDTRLHSVVVRTSTGIAFDERQFIQAFDTIAPWNPEKRERFYRYHDQWKMNFFKSEMHLLDGAWGFDIERPSDNLLCTVRLTGSAFCFFVWHERFPNARHAE